MSGPLSCPKCGNSVAAAKGAQQAQCFSCGTTVQLGRSPTNNNPTTNNPAANKSSMKLVVILLGVLSCLGLLAVVAISLFLSIDPAPADSNPVATSTTSSTQGDNPPADAPPPVVASEEERRLAATVNESKRKQIVDMWEQMRATTSKTIPLPKGNVVRNSTERMLGGFEQRELKRMAALLDLNEDQVRAVVQVHLADQTL